MTTEHLCGQSRLNADSSDTGGTSWSLCELLSEWVTVSAASDRQVQGVQLDSRLVVEGDLFIALEGLTVNALDFLNDVIAANAVAVLADSGNDRPTLAERSLLDGSMIPLIEIDNLSSIAGEIISRCFSDPSRSLKVVGVTGTDGKTSVCHMLGQALNEHRANCGVIGTLGWGVSGELTGTGLTTPDAVKLQMALSQFYKERASYAAMEVSSHALSQNRTAGIIFDVVVLTNLGRDHLDYHGDMKNYRAAKEALFFQPGLRAAVINTDDEFGRSLVGRLTDLEVTTYGSDFREGSHVQYVDLLQSSSGLQFTLKFDGVELPVKSTLIGKFNVQNLAATFAVLVALGVSPNLAAQSLSGLKAVPGRMEAIRLANGAMAIVDYAHNPHALESVLRSVSEHTEGQLLLVFGCGGDRDKGKRSLMAGVAERYADVCIVTDDNPRSEDGDEIVEQILAGFQDPGSATIERDRAAAIEMAIGAAKTGDLVIVAGKGHEDYQLVGDRRLPFSDSAVIVGYGKALAS